MHLISGNNFANPHSLANSRRFIFVYGLCQVHELHTRNLYSGVIFFARSLTEYKSASALGWLMFYGYFSSHDRLNGQVHICSKTVICSNLRPLVNIVDCSNYLLSCVSLIWGINVQCPWIAACSKGTFLNRHYYYQYLLLIYSYYRKADVLVFLKIV